MFQYPSRSFYLESRAGNSFLQFAIQNIGVYHTMERVNLAKVKGGDPISCEPLDKLRLFYLDFESF